MQIFGHTPTQSVICIRESLLSEDYKLSSEGVSLGDCVEPVKLTVFGTSLLILKGVVGYRSQSANHKVTKTTNP